MVGVKGFEPSTPCSQSRCANRTALHPERKDGAYSHPKAGAKITSFLIKKMNRGSGVTLPGYVARRIDPHILKEISGQVREKILVTMNIVRIRMDNRIRRGYS